MASVARYIVQNDFFGVRPNRSSKRSSNADDDAASSSSLERPAPKRSKDSDSMDVDETQRDSSQQSSVAVRSAPHTKDTTEMRADNNNDDDELDEIDAILNQNWGLENANTGKEDDDDEDDEDGLPKQTFVRKFKGHISSMTIKGYGHKRNKQEEGKNFSLATSKLNAEKCLIRRGFLFLVSLLA